MRPTSQCLYNSRRALYRVFISASEGSTGLTLPRPKLSLFPTTHRNTLILTQIRRYAHPKPARNRRGETTATATAELARSGRGFDKNFTTQEDIDRSGRDRPPQDHEITDPKIMVLDKGITEGPLTTSYVLTKLEPDESLRMIHPYVPADREKETRPLYAVCKIINKRDEYERQKQVKENKKAGAGKPKTKELEMTWAIGEHDMTTKLRQMGQFLGKGMKVEILVAKKKGGKKLDGKEAEGVVRRIREEIESLGAREVKSASGEIGGSYRLFVEGKQK